ncbi:MAG: pyridoxal phosphate-dependent aminotransferase [Promethearchaeota archaeon]
MSFEFDPSGTVEVFNLAKELEAKGHELVHLEVGELDHDTPEYVVDAAVRSLKEGHTRYTVTRGQFDLREQISEYTARRYGLESLDPERQVLVTPGAKFGLFLGLLSLLAPGDEVVVFSPSFPTFRAIPKAMHVKIREVGILDGPRTIPTGDIFEDFKRQVNERTRVVILNGPCNPTGQVIGPALVEMIWKHVQEFPRVIFLADDIYEQFIYPPATFNTPAHHDRDLSRTVLVNGLSKSFCMTGFRVGWVVTNSSLLEKLERIQQNSVTCLQPFVQDAAEVAVRSMNEQWPEYRAFREEVRRSLLERKEYILPALDGLAGVTCNEAEGAFYVFPDISGVTPDDRKFCRELLKEGVVLTPGSAFGKGGPGHVRLCYTKPLEELGKSVEVMGRFVERQL